MGRSTEWWTVAERAESRRVLGPLEAEVMHLLWAADGPRSVREVLDGLNAGRRPPLAYTTIMTVLARLAEKGVLERTLAGRGFVYTPAVGDEAAIAVRGVVQHYGEAALAHFVEQARADPKLYRRLQRLLREEGR
jgi:predicted transcriptional regulator